MKHHLTKYKQIITIVLTGLIVFGGMIGQIVVADEVISISERRKLAKFPDITVHNIFSGKVKDELELYLADAFPMRDTYRKLKATAMLKMLGKSDLNGLYFVEGHLSKIEDKLNETQIAHLTKKMNEIAASYLSDMNVYYAVIPDKHYFLGASGGYPSIDYDLLMTLVKSSVLNMTEIELFDTLSIDDFYRTDPHIKQESLEALMRRLSEKMGFKIQPFNQYIVAEYGDFNGAYAAQSGLDTSPDKLNYLIHNNILSSTVYDFEKNSYFDVYTEALDLEMDAYALFMGGASAIQVMENPDGETGKELILFRDSFGSSIAPLLLSGYDKITLVDLRYVSSTVLDRYINFTDQDILFLYSTSVINWGGMIR